MIRSFRASLAVSLLFLNPPTLLAEGSKLEPAAGELISFDGWIYPRRFMGVRGEPFGHHAIVWKEGRAASRALIIADIPDMKVADVLEAKGLKSGNNLDAKTWDRRSDLSDRSAEERVEGASVEVWIKWPGGTKWRRLGDMLGIPDADYRFGDHRGLIPVWRSGCIVCNVSCPGGKISNRSLTVRDQAEGRLRPILDPETFPPDGTPVRVKITRREGLPGGSPATSIVGQD